MSGAPTTDCAICGRTAKACNDWHAKGWDGCCQGCDGTGRINAHRLRMTTTDPDRRPPASGHTFPCATAAGPGEAGTAPPVGPVPHVPTPTQGEQP